MKTKEIAEAVTKARILHCFVIAPALHSIWPSSDFAPIIDPLPFESPLKAWLSLFQNYTSLVVPVCSLLIYLVGQNLCPDMPGHTFEFAAYIYIGLARDSDALYMIFSMLGFYALFSEQRSGRTQPPAYRVLLASFCFAVAILADPRLGPSLIVFILFHAGHNVLQSAGNFFKLAKHLITAFWSLLPILIAQFFASSWMPYVVICEPKLHRTDILPAFCTDSSWPNLTMMESR